FQPEDGIRDRNVTGVQTCALPIYLSLIHTVCSNKWISKGEICYGITDFPYSLPFTSHDILIDTYTDSTLEKYNEVRKCSKRLWLQRMDLTIPYKQRNMPVN